MSKFTTFAVMVLAVFLAAAWGCKGKYPPVSSMTRTAASMSDNVIDTFEDANAFYNPALRGAPNGTWVNYGTAGQGVLNTSNFVVPNANPSGINTTATAAHLLGTLKDPGNASYPEATLQGRFNVAPACDRTDPRNLSKCVFYDASSFTGLRYMVRIASADTAVKRRFKMTIANTVPVANGGFCIACGLPGGGCWNAFGGDFTVPRDTWVQQSYTFATMTREAWGCAIIPASFSGINLKQLIGLDWCASRDNVLGTSLIDFWVDEVEFF